MKNNNSFSIIALGISGVSLLASGYIICSDSKFNADWYAIVVGILALLVTVLIGWNIYTVIDTKNLIKEIHDQSNLVATKADIQYERLSVSVYSVLFDFYKKDGTNIFEYFSYGLLVIKHSQAINNIGVSNAMIKVLNESFPTTKPITNFHKANLISIVNNIESIGLIGLDQLKKNIFLMMSSDVV